MLTMLGSFDLSNFSSRPFWIICGTKVPVGTTMSNPLRALRRLQLGDEVLVADVVADLHLDAEVLLGERTDDVGVVVGTPGVHVQVARRLVGDTAVVAAGDAEPGAAVADIAGAGSGGSTRRCVPPRAWFRRAVASLATLSSSPQAAATIASPAAAPPIWNSVRARELLRKLCGARILSGFFLDDMTCSLGRVFVGLDGDF